jgi:hypothetical protein
MIFCIMQYYFVLLEKLLYLLQQNICPYIFLHFFSKEGYFMYRLYSTFNDPLTTHYYLYSDCQL